MKKIQIALVDDHQLFLDGLEAVLSKQDDIDVVFQTTSASALLDFLQLNTPDIILTDIAMPEMNGIELIKAIKKQSPHIKLLVLSMFQNMHSYTGIQGYLLKETPKIEVLEAIRGIVNEDKTYFNYTEQPIEEYIFNKNILSKREKQIVQLIAQELTNEEIAEKLFLSKRTVETHRKNIFFKMGVKSPAGLIKKAMHLGIVN
ncbi:putative transcriptional regulatory protein YxjL [Flavobacteriaceae bacterium UJ101]|nr:putative transcriptional regulatory protein YxjL [Flavobacteriaceae bacterium UJ101]